MSTIHQPDDKAFKVLLQNQKAFIQLLRTFLSTDWVNQIDEHALRRLDKSFILPNYKSQESDIIYHCKLKGTDIIFYVLLELQSTVDQQMSWRLLQYMVELWRSIQGESDPQERRRKTFRLPAIIPIVVYNGTRRWSAATQFKDYLANSELFGDAVLSFQYHVFDLKRWTPADTSQLRQLLPLALNLDNANGLDAFLIKLQESVDAIRQLDEQELTVLKQFMYKVMHPMARSISQIEMSKLLKDLLDNGKDGEEMVSSLSRKLYKEALALEKKGHEEGRSEGRNEGHTEGRKQVALKMLREGCAVELIAKVTDLSREDINGLKEANPQG